jgi:Mce-associated membrane protein
VADKDVEVTEAAAARNGAAPEPAEPVDAAKNGQPAADPQPPAGAETGAEPDEAANDPDEAANDPDKAANDPDKAANDPDKAANDPDKAANDPDEAAKDAGPDAAGETGPGGRRGWRAVAALGAATVVLGGFGVWATLHASSLRGAAAAQNTALTDGPATAAVRREISAAVNTIFSYNYADTAATRRAAQSVLTGPAVREYNTLFALVTKNAPAEKLVVATRVTSSGVELLSGGRARVLVFANQQDTMAGTSRTSYAGAMFAVTALRQGGRWKIEHIDTFSG